MQLGNSRSPVDVVLLVVLIDKDIDIRTITCHWIDEYKFFNGTLINSEYFFEFSFYVVSTLDGRKEIRSYLLNKFAVVGCTTAATGERCCCSASASAFRSEPSIKFT